MELKFSIIDGLPTVTTQFGTLSLVELQDKYKSAWEVPSALLTLCKVSTGEMGQLGLYTDLSVDSTKYDQNRASYLIDEALVQLIRRAYAGSDWSYETNTMHRGQVYPAYHQHDQHNTAEHTSVVVRTSSLPGTMPSVRISLPNNVLFLTETINTLPVAHRLPEAKFHGTVKVFGGKVRFSIFTNSVPMERLDQDAIVVELKNVLAQSFPRVDILSQFDFYADLETAVAPKLLRVTIPPLDSSFASPEAAASLD